MPNFEIEYEYKIKEFGAITLPADNTEQADEFGMEYIKETYDGISDIVITGIRELPVSV